MKNIVSTTTVKAVLGALVLACGAVAVPARAADVGVSVSIGQPGFYGRIDIGNRPPPVLMYPQPVVIQQPVYGVVQRPIYLRVPPGHERNWGKHCARYAACGQPVYFVQDSWYQEQYVRPYYRDHPGYDRDRRGRGGRDDHDHGHRGRGHDKGHGKGHDR